MSALRPLLRFLPLWAFIGIFKVAAVTHYELLPVLGERVFSVSVVGVLIGAGALLQLLLDVPAGMLIDRFGYRRMLAVTTCAFALAGIALLGGITPMAFVATIIAGTLGWLFFDPGNAAYLLAHAPHAYAARVMSLRDTTEAAGGIIAAAFLAVFLTFPIPMIGVFLLVGFALAGVALVFVPRASATVHDAPRIHTHHYFIRRTKLRTLLAAMRRLNPASSLLMASGFVSATFYGAVWFVVPIAIAQSAEHGIPGIGLGIFDLAVLLLGVALGRLADRLNRERLIFIGLFLFALAASMLGFTAGVWFIVIGFLASVGDELASVSLWSWLHHLDRDHASDGAIAGLITMVQDLGWTVGPILGGVLLPLIGSAWSITAAASLIGVVWVVYAFQREHVGVRLFPRGEAPQRPHTRRHKR